MKGNITWMWQEMYGGRKFRFQSEDEEVRERMRQRSDFIQIQLLEVVEPTFIN